MDKSHYFDLMRETTARAYPLLSRHIDSVKDIDADLHRIIRYVVDRRNNELLLKPFLLRLAYELCGGSNWEKTVPVGAAFELLNISSYQANSSFDNKHAVLSFPEKNSQFIASMVTRELCLECLVEAERDFDMAVLDEVRRDLSTCNKHIYIAQHYDLNLLTIERFDCYADEDVFMREYTSRCFHGSGIFTGRCARAGALLAGASGEKCAALQAFGEEFGTGLHFMNDLADFVPSGMGQIVGRGFQDPLSDIKNGRLTLGCYLLASERESEGHRLLCDIQAGDVSARTLTSLVSYMNRDGIIRRIRKHGKCFAEKARAAVSSFCVSEPQSLLSLMASSCYSNKYTKALITKAQNNKDDT